MIYFIHKSSKGIIQLHIDISYYLSAELCPASLLLPRSNSGSDAWPRHPYSLLLLAARASRERNERRVLQLLNGDDSGKNETKKEEKREKKKRGRKTETEQTVLRSSAM